MDWLRPQDSSLYVPPSRQAETVDLRPLLGDTSSALKGGTIVPATRQGDWQFDMPTIPYGPAPRDGGGVLYGYYTDVLRADMASREIRIRGTCISACTVYLGAKNVCVEPDAMLWFHAASDGDRTRPDVRATEHMMTYYPDPVRDWARKTGVDREVTFTRRRALSGEELIRMGVKRCA